MIVSFLESGLTVETKVKSDSRKDTEKPAKTLAISRAFCQIPFKRYFLLRIPGPFISRVLAAAKVEKGKNVGSLWPPSGAPRRIGDGADEERRRRRRDGQT
jgi:hypothetical protein